MDNNTFKVEGAVVRVGEPETFKTFTKAELVVEITDGKYEQTVSFEVSGKALDHLDKFAPGSKVEVSFNLRGREYTGKDGVTRVFNTLSAWKVSEAGFSL